MTRDFNKPRRDDVRPFSRPQPTYRQENEQTPRPARPRLNRESVDRAWESGAPTQHADYRTRSNNGQPPRNSWRNNQPSEHSSAQNGRKPFGPRPDVDGNRRFDRPSNGNYQDNRSRSFDTARNPNQIGERRNNEYRGNTGGPNRYGARPDNGNAPRRPYEPNRPNRPYRPYGQHNPNGNAQPHSRPPFREQSAERDHRSFNRDQHSGTPQTGGSERPARSFDQNSRPPRSFERDSRPPRDFDRNSRPPRSFERDSRPPYHGQQRDTQNPRWQSRPAVQRNLASREQPSEEASLEHFEGDYERFNKPARPEFQRRQPRKEYRRPSAPVRPFQGKQTPDKPETGTEEEERHVTRLSDGRVLKGPRPVQRKNAQFWTEISKEAENLVEQVEVPTPLAETEDTATAEHSVAATQEASSIEAEQVVALPAVSEDGTETPSTKRKPRKGPASSAARAKNPKVKPATPKGPKPSQRGHKWPTP